MAARTIQFSNHVSLIALPPPISGFTDFINVWLYTGRISFLVDVGPSITMPDLITALTDLNIPSLDFILLTHIHLDHAGGIGEIIVHFPKTPVICHAAAMPHLVDPSKLVAGTIKTLGETGRAYGPVTPVPENRLIATDDFRHPDIVVIPTPGHSAHHVSFQVGEHLFAGEAGGVHIEISSKKDYMRPATPPRFFPDIFINSIDRLIENAPEYICYGHFGRSANATDMLKKQKRQLLSWHDIIQNEIDKKADDGLEERIVSRVLSEDPLLSGFSLMDADTQKRERFFLANSIKGFVKALRD